jgi:hypothetical protein
MHVWNVLTKTGMHFGERHSSTLIMQVQCLSVRRFSWPLGLQCQGQKFAFGSQQIEINDMYNPKDVYREFVRDLRNEFLVIAVIGTIFFGVLYCVSRLI